MAGDKRKGKKGVFYLFTFDVVGNESPFAGEVDGGHGHGPLLVIEGPFTGEVDGGHGHGPSLVIRSPLRRLT